MPRFLFVVLTLLLILRRPRPSTSSGTVALEGQANISSPFAQRQRVALRRLQFDGRIEPVKGSEPALDARAQGESFRGRSRSVSALSSPPPAHADDDEVVIKKAQVTRISTASRH
jgi:hypothetical protein